MTEFIMAERQGII